MQTPITYIPSDGFSFENASVEQAVFESKLEERGIKFFKNESFNLNATPYSGYNFLPEDIKDVNEIYESIFKNRVLVPETKAQVAFDIFGKWFSRIFLALAIAGIVLVIYAYFATRLERNKPSLDEIIQKRL